VLRTHGFPKSLTGTAVLRTSAPPAGKAVGVSPVLRTHGFSKSLTGTPVLRTSAPPAGKAVGVSPAHILDQPFVFRSAGDHDLTVLFQRADDVDHLLLRLADLAHAGRAEDLDFLAQ
jgi:hypothetical protein